MRILLVTGSYPPMKCGVGDYSQLLAEALAEQGADAIGVLTSVGVGEPGVRSGVHLFPVIHDWGIGDVLSAFRVLRNWAPDIVHIQYPTQGYGRGGLVWLLSWLAFLMRMKVVQTWHERFSRRQAFVRLLQSVVTRAFVFVRSRYVEDLHPHLQWILKSHHCVHIPNASAIPRFKGSDHLRAAIKMQHLSGQRRLIVFFGFIYPHKGLELLFDVCDPELDQIVVAGEIPDDDYAVRIKNLAASDDWRGKVVLTGYLPVETVADLLAVADAVILPFKHGGGEWNTSIHGAILNGAFVITTSLSVSGYDEKRNVYFAKIDDTGEMREALSRWGGVRRVYAQDFDSDEWRSIAEKHFLLYERLLASK